MKKAKMSKRILIAICMLVVSYNYSQNIKFGKVSKAELEEQFYPLDSTAEAAYLFRKRRTFYEFSINDGFQVITKVHERIKIYKKEGFKKANKTIRYYKPDSGSREQVNSIKGITYNLVNGEIEKQKLSKKAIFDEKESKYRSVKKITMPNIKEGSVIDLRYEIHSPYDYSIRNVDFQFDIPVKNFNCKIEIPEYYHFNARYKGYYFPKKKPSRKSGKITFKNGKSLDFTTNVSEYVGTNVPALKDDEPFVNNIYNYRGGARYELSLTKFPNTTIESYSTTWEKVSKQIYSSPHFGGELKKTHYFKKDLATILNTITEDVDKVFAIFHFVKSKVKWNRYPGKYTEKGVKKAYKEGEGNVADINLMLTAMLREAGLNANPVLVSTRNHGVPIFPTLDGFNYVITMVELADGFMLLDATEPYSSPNVLPSRALNWNGRKVMKGGVSSWVELTPRNFAKENHTISVKITEDNEVSGLMKNQYSGFNALHYRKNNNALQQEKLIEKLEEEYPIEIDNFRVSNKNEIHKPIVQMVTFSSEDLVEEINGKLYIDPLLFLSTKVNPFKSKERKFPVDFITPWRDTHTILIKIPENYTVVSVPKTLGIVMLERLGVFKFVTKVEGNLIKIQSLLQISNAILAPKEYPSLKDFYSKVTAQQAEKIVLSKK